MFKIASFLLIALSVSLQISAQCGGYFKESGRQVFSNPFNHGYFEDFDGDGLQDLFGYSVTNQSSPRNFQVQYYKRLSENSFETTAKSTSISNIAFTFGVFGDVNGDGKKDLIVSHPSTLVTYLNDGTGAFSTTTPSVPAASDGYVWAAGDLNGDGKADIITAPYNSLSSTTIYYRLTQPDNSFGAPVQITAVTGVLIPSNQLDNFASPVLLEDLNGDGLKDLSYVTHNEGKLHVLTNNGDLTFTETFSTEFYLPNVRLKAFDFNNDGKKDFISNAIQFGSVKLAINNGNNTFTASSLSLTTSINNSYNSYSTKEFLAADFDNDGDTDLLYPGSVSYTVLRNQGNATFVRQEVKGLFKVDGVANLDGDGKADILSLNQPLIDGAYRLNDGTNNYYYRLHSSVAFKKNVCDSVGQTKIVDFNNDGYTDRALWLPSNGTWRVFSDRYNSSTNFTSFQWGFPGDVPVPNDYDGDGQTDFAVYRKSTGTWLYRRTSNNQDIALNFGISEDKPVPADYDGDGKADLAVFRPSTGDWHLLLSSTGQYGVLHFGISEDKPVPADYDGDGKADVAVFRPSTGVWYRFNSADYTVSVIWYGIGTDKPIPGDYDADGKANIAVYRDGIWYVLRDNFSTTVFYWGTANDQPFFDDTVSPSIGVFRRSNSVVYTTVPPIGLFGTLWGTGNSSTDIFASSILPPE